MGISKLTREQERIIELLRIPGLTRKEQDLLRSLYHWRKTKWTPKQKDFLESIEFKINALLNPIDEQIVAEPSAPEYDQDTIRAPMLTVEEPEGKFVTFTAEQVEKIKEADEQNRRDTLKELLGENWNQEGEST